MGSVLSVEEYRQSLLELVHTLEPVTVPIAGSADDALALLGTVLADDAVSGGMLPRFDSSAMDGYAVCTADLGDCPVQLPVLGDIPAGDTRALRLSPGSCWRIMTGAPVPDGADAVVQVELTDGGTKTVRIERAVPAGSSVRPAGEDVRPGDRVLTAGTTLAAHNLPVLLSAQVGKVSVRPRPRVSVVSTGDELRPPGVALQHGQIVDSNGPMLAALATQGGFDVVEIAHVGDSGEQTARMLRRLVASCDAVITSGGVSAGAFEPIRLAFTDQTMHFVKIAMQPGKPQAYGLLDGTPVFGLPGNPVSSLVSFLLLVAPALRTMAGRSAKVPTTPREVAVGWRPAEARMQAARVHVRPDGRIEPSGGSGSHLLGGLAAADGLALVPVDAQQVTPGDVLPVVQL